MELAAGTIVDDRYRVISQIGAGGMARVYRATDTRLDVDVALKVLSLPLEAVAERLRREGKVQARLKHPNVLNVTDIVVVNGLPGLVMELIEGPSLAEVLAEPIEMAQADHLARGILAGVEAAHRAGVVHRDLKPGNVLLSLSADAVTAKVADFGLVKLVEGDQGLHRTRTGTAMGTPQYMAPEQIRDAGSVDNRADLFAFGCILYELYCGATAFEGADTYAVFNAVIEGRFTPPRELCEGLPERVEQAILACLSADPDERPQSCAALREMLGEEPTSHWSMPSLDRVPSPPVETSADTWLAQSTLIDNPAESRNTVTSGAVTKGRGWVVAAVLSSVLALLATSWFWPTNSPYLTATSVPTVSEDVVVQQGFADVWAAVLRNDDVRARSALLAIDSPPNDGAYFALAALVHLNVSDGQQFTAAAQRGSAFRGPYAAMLAPFTELDSLQDIGWREAHLAHMNAYPEDLLGQLLYVSVAAETGPLQAGDVDVAKDVQSRYPEHPAVWMGHLWMLDNLNRRDEALAVAQRAIERHPGSPALHFALANQLCDAGQTELCVDEAEASLRLDQAWYPARFLLAAVAIEAGDDAALRAHDTAMSGETVRDEQRLMWTQLVLRAMMGAGRVHESDEWFARYRAVEAASPNAENRYVQVMYRLILTSNPWLMNSRARGAKAIEDLEDLLVDPALTNNRVEVIRSISFEARAAFAGLEGDIEAERRAVEAFKEKAQGPMSPPLRIRAALDEGDWNAIAADGLEQATCDEMFTRARVLLDHSRSEAAALFGRLVDADCVSRSTTDAIYRGFGYAGLALDAHQAGRHAPAEDFLKRSLDALAVADPDLPVFSVLAEAFGPEVYPNGALAAYGVSRPEPLFIGLSPILGQGVNADTSAGLTAVLRARLEATDNIRLVSVAGPDEASKAGVDFVLGGEVARLGDLMVLTLARHDVEAGQEGARASWESHALDDVRVVDGLLVMVLSATERLQMSEEIRASIRGYALGAMKPCYAEQLALEEVSGLITLNWRVMPSGRVEDIVVTEDTVGKPDLKQCVVEQLADVVYPPGIEGEVTWPFLFNRSKDSKPPEGAQVP
jgi:serine/threonine protein kinase/tetratricopeptide (TPR) repeat protein